MDVRGLAIQAAARSATRQPSNTCDSLGSKAFSWVRGLARGPEARPSHALAAGFGLLAQKADMRMRAFFDEWGPTLTFICTRKSDGAAIKVAVFDTRRGSWGAVDRSDEHVILNFNTGDYSYSTGVEK